MILLAWIFLIGVLMAMERIYFETDLIVFAKKSGMTGTLKRVAASGREKMSEMGKTVEKGLANTENLHIISDSFL